MFQSLFWPIKTSDFRNPVNFQLFAKKNAINCTNWFETHDRMEGRGSNPLARAKKTAARRANADAV